MNQYIFKWRSLLFIFTSKLIFRVRFLFFTNEKIQANYFNYLLIILNKLKKKLKISWLFKAKLLLERFHVENDTRIDMKKQPIVKCALLKIYDIKFYELLKYSVDFLVALRLLSFVFSSNLTCKLFFIFQVSTPWLNSQVAQNLIFLNTLVWDSLKIYFLNLQFFKFKTENGLLLEKKNNEVSSSQTLKYNLPLKKSSEFLQFLKECLQLIIYPSKENFYFWKISGHKPVGQKARPCSE